MTKAIPNPGNKFLNLFIHSLTFSLVSFSFSWEKGVEGREVTLLGLRRLVTVEERGLVLGG